MTDKTRNNRHRSQPKKEKKPLPIFLIDHALALVMLLCYVLAFLSHVQAFSVAATVLMLLLFGTWFSKAYFKLQAMLRLKIMARSIDTASVIAKDTVPDLPSDMVKVLNAAAKQQASNE